MHFPLSNSRRVVCPFVLDARCKLLRAGNCRVEKTKRLFFRQNGYTCCSAVSVGSATGGEQTTIAATINNRCARVLCTSFFGCERFRAKKMKHYHRLGPEIARLAPLNLSIPQRRAHVRDFAVFESQGEFVVEDGRFVRRKERNSKI